MKISIHKETLNGIKCLQYKHPRAEKLLFLQHGIHSKKENVMNLYGITLAKLGYNIIALDAYKHGERIEEPFISKEDDQCTLETMDVVKHTAYDIKAIYENHFKDRYKTFDFIGISMGGMIAYYLSTITKHIDQLVALISSPQFLETANYVFPLKRQQVHQEQSQNVIKELKNIDPSTRTEHMHFHRLIMLNGKHDNVIPANQSQRFYEDHPDLPIMFKLYDTDHKVNQAMFEDLQDLLKESFRS